MTLRVDWPLILEAGRRLAACYLPQCRSSLKLLTTHGYASRFSVIEDIASMFAYDSFVSTMMCSRHDRCGPKRRPERSEEHMTCPNKRPRSGLSRLGSVGGGGFCMTFFDPDKINQFQLTIRQRFLIRSAVATTSRCDTCETGNLPTSYLIRTVDNDFAQTCAGNSQTSRYA